MTNPASLRSVSVRGWVNPRVIVRLEGLCQCNIPVTPSGIDPPTFQFVAQCLNQLRHRLLLTYYLLKCINCEAPDVACTSSCYLLYFRFEYSAEPAYTVVWHPRL